MIIPALFCTTVTTDFFFQEHNSTNWYDTVNSEAQLKSTICNQQAKDLVAEIKTYRNS